VQCYRRDNGQLYEAVVNMQTGELVKLFNFTTGRMIPLRTRTARNLRNDKGFTRLPENSQ
jgi:hypothetical protein